MTYEHCPHCGLTRAERPHSLASGHCPRCLTRGERIELVDGGWPRGVQPGPIGLADGDAVLAEDRS